MPHGIVASVVRATLGLAVVVVLSRQCRRPAWFLGRLVAQGMNLSHAAVTAWGLDHLSIAPDATILDIGCGGGQTVATLASLATRGTVHGVDYSPASVAVARRLNAQRIEHGTVDIRLASVSDLPYPRDAFDVVTAIETHYYWPDLPRALREVLRVLKPRGTLAVIAETYRGRRMDWLYRPAMGLLGATYLTVAEHRELLAGAGYCDVAVFEERSKGWICAIGHKPEAVA